jgi:hypothetical protein
MDTRRLCHMAAALFITVALLFNPSATYAKSYNPSPWADQIIAYATTAGICPKDFDARAFTDNITRQEFCELLINTCRSFHISLPTAPESHPFKDTGDINVEYAYLLGLTNGTDINTFSPDMPLSREMAAVMLSKLLTLFQSTPDYKNISIPSKGSISYRPPLDQQEAVKILTAYAVDSNLISDWAKIYMADLINHGILQGSGGGRLEPKSKLSREQAVILSFNVLTYCDERRIQAAGVTECVLPKPTGIFISPSYYQGDVYLNWNDLPLASAYDVSVYKNGQAAYIARIDKNYLDLRSRSASYNRVSRSYVYTDYNNPLYKQLFGDEKQTINAAVKVVPVNSNGEPSVFSLTQEFTIKPWANANEMIFGDPARSSFASAHEAALNMTTIQVRVWKLSSSGLKIPSTMTLTIHKNLASDVKKIFDHIYQGPEKFPIKSCVGYAYRSGRSEHNNGTAIDINPAENYFVDREGKIKAGTLWKPGQNPYSIVPDGDVVQAFNRYGWHWSPDMHWSNGADYMHFSLFGT